MTSNDADSATPPAAAPGAGPVLVTGGTGLLGKLVVPRLQRAGCSVRVLARKVPVPADALDGVEYFAADLSHVDTDIDAFDGVQTVVHCAGSAKGDEDKAKGVVRAAAKAGSRHIVFISVVGADRVPVVSGVDRAMYGYFGQKLAAERVIERSALPYTILRATQFHELVWESARLMSKSPVVPTPKVEFQPIDAGDVADRLTELALGKPTGLVPEMGGSRSYSFADLVRDYLRATRKHRVLMPMRQPGRAAQAFREGANLTPSKSSRGQTWESFVERQQGN